MPDDGDPPRGDEGAFGRLVRQLGGKPPDVEHRLIQAFIDFEADLPIVRELRSVEARKWFKSVSAASRKLADLLEKDAQRVFGTVDMGHPWADWVLRELLKETHTYSTALEILVVNARALWKPKVLIEDLRRMAAAADNKSLFAQFRGNRRRQWHLHDLILDIAIIYEDGTGKKAGRSTTPTTNKPGGPFFRIVRDCYSYLGIMKTDDAIALDIRKALKQRKPAVVGK
jgi:hypothetical protein